MLYLPKSKQNKKARKAQFSGFNPCCPPDIDGIRDTIKGFVSPEQAAKELLIRREAAENLLTFTTYTKPNFRVSKHHELICSVLEMVANGVYLPGFGKMDRVMLCAPPRHTKSELASIRFPAWYLGKFPDRQIIATSYSDELAIGFGRTVRNLIDSPRYHNIFPGTTLRQDSKAANRWNTAQGGSYISAGFKSSITGFGMNIGLIDDYVKGRAEARSSAWWGFVREWYKNDFYSRLMPESAIVIVATRWVEDDLIGWLNPTDMVKFMDDLDEVGDRWLVINMPALAGENDILGRKIGEALWPDWYPADRLYRIRKVLGDSFEALYQQNPSAQEGNIFKRDWWGWYDELPSIVNRTIDSWDTGFKAGVTNAYSSNLTIAECNDGYYITDWFRDKMEYPELKAMVRMRWESKRTNPLLIEDKASGTPLIQELHRGTLIPVIGIPCNENGKELRCIAASPVVKAGKVKLPRNKQWAHDFVELMARYPNVNDKDTPDAFSQGIIWLNENSFAPVDYEQVIARRFGMSSRGFL